jgi:predicted GNAT superfamily acetyltransferase
MSRLADLTRVLLDRKSPTGELLRASRQLHSDFVRCTGVHEKSDDARDRSPIRLDCGVAIAPADAGRCIVDFVRTVRFLRGIRRAIDDRWIHRDDPVRVLYAGCGPFATLALPLCTIYSPDQVRFTLLDVHARSVEAVEMLVREFGLESHVEEIVRGDATDYTAPRGVDLVVAEIMQRALSKEPQLAVSAHLAPQLEDGGALIPERVTVELQVAELEAGIEGAPPGEVNGDGKSKRLRLGRVIDLTKRTAPEILRTADRASRRFRVPELEEDRQWHAMLCTEVVVYGDEVLGDYDSGVSYPERLRELGPLEGGEELDVRYRPGTDPGFEVRRVQPPLLRDAVPDDAPAILELNLESEHLLSPLDPDRLQWLQSMSELHRVVEVDGRVVAFLLALREGQPYDSPNYRWFDASRPQFLYVDRVVVSREHRGRRLASQLYDDLFAHARILGVHEIAAEFDVDPPNAASRAFHSSYGFVEVGDRRLDDGRRVSMQIATLSSRRSHVP